MAAVEVATGNGGGGSSSSSQVPPTVIAVGEKGDDFLAVDKKPVARSSSNRYEM